MTYVGIDVSKATFVVAYSSAKTGRTKTFKNTVKGVHEFIQTVSAAEHHCVLEATGNYSALLVYLLSEAGITVSLENPLKIKNFARAMLSVTKTDEIDARLIALYGERMQPVPYKLRSGFNPHPEAETHGTATTQEATRGNTQPQRFTGGSSFF